MKKVLITAGPTNEYIDEVMKITNMSTGRLGIELAKHYLESGRNVTLIATRSVFRSGLFEKYHLSEHINLKTLPNISNENAIANILNAQSANNQTSSALLLFYKKANDLFVYENILQSAINTIT